MSDKSPSNLDRYALIALIADRLGEKQRLGKKALQKIVHLLQEFGEVRTGYRFSFYTYGPYSTELAGDLDLVAAKGGVSVAYNSSDNYYLISSTSRTKQVVEKGESFIKPNKTKIDKVLDKFGGRLAKDLELVSTIAYVRRYAPDEFANDQTLARLVKELKPKYEDDEIKSAMAEVKKFLREGGRHS